MSDDLRQEAASIAHALRRHVERERALGGGELLALGVAQARAKGIALPDLSAYTAPAAEPAAKVATHALIAAESAPATTPTPTALDPVSPLRITRPRKAAPASASTIELPPFVQPLNASALGGGRETIMSASLPVLQGIAAEACACKRCGLCETRKQAVPGVGSAYSGIVFVGEAPGADEDEQGEPFVGKAGQLLTRMIEAMDERKLIPGLTLTRETVYIVNVLKCRPPENRDPATREIEMCSPYLMRQLEALQPRVILCLGKFAAELLLGLKGTIKDMRGKTYRWKGAKLIVTYHPAFCLRDPRSKAPVWEDLQRLAQEYLADQ